MPQPFFTPTKHIAALDAHLNLIDHLERPMMHKFWDGILQAQGSSQTGAYPAYEADPGWENLTEGEIACTHEGVRLSHSPTYWISPPVLDLIAENVAVLPEDVRIHPYDLVTQRGFAYFDHLIETVDIHDKVCTIKALSWSTTVTNIRTWIEEGDQSVGLAPGMVFTWWSDMTDFGADEYIHDIPDRHRAQIVESAGPLIPFLHVVVPFSTATDEFNQIPVGGVDKATAGYRRLQDDLDLDPTLSLMVGGNSLDDWTRSFFLVIGQRLMSKVKPGRQIRRRMERREAPDWGEVRVIDLRRYTEQGRPRNPNAQDDDWWHEWSHRHRVKAHWARRWVKVEGQDEKVLVWRPVKSYIRGPDHLPLIERDDVYRAVR